MTKEEAISKSIEIANEIDDAIANSTLDEALKNTSEDDWTIYVKVTKSTLDEAFKDKPDTAIAVGKTYNGVVRRRGTLRQKGEL